MAPSRSEQDRLRLRPVATPGVFLDQSAPAEDDVSGLKSYWAGALRWARRWLPLPDKPRAIRKVVVIGIHGWAVLGGRLFSWSPSDVSMRMAQSLAAAVRQRLKTASEANLDVTIVPLFGHGLVDARLDDVLVDQLPAHKQAFLDADAVCIAAHSQGGTPYWPVC